jgi:hypothetical protein
MSALLLYGSSGYDYYYETSYTAIYSGATQDWNLVLPTGPGSNGQYLQTNGHGVTSWVTISTTETWAALTGDLTETQVIPWDGGTPGTKDTGISRLGAASLAIGNGTASDITGALTLKVVNISDTGANADLVMLNTTAATALTTNASPLHEFSVYYDNAGTFTGLDTWSIGSSIAAGSNGVSTLTFSHSGSTGTAVVSFPGNVYMPETSGLGIGFGNQSGNFAGMIYNSTNGVELQSNGNPALAIQAAKVIVSSAVPLIWGSSAFATPDSGISRIGAASLAIGNGTAGDKTGALSLSRINAFSADLAGSVTSSPTGIVASKVVVAVGGTTGTFTVTSTEGFTIGDTVTLSAGGWAGGSGLASTTCTVTTITGGVTLLLTYVSGGPWVAGTYTAQTGTLLQTGVTSVTVTYVVAYTNTPFVTVTPTSNCGAWYVSAQSTAGFTITYATSGTMTFNYHVIGNQS